MKTIIHVPHTVLITPTKPVGVVDKKIKQLIAEMKAALIAADNPKGVGLAATQIGESLRIFVMRPAEKDELTTYINPKITGASKETVRGIPGSDSRVEGCLSIPNIWGIVRRHKRVTLSFTTEDGKLYEKKFTGFRAIIIQHEVDHLDGILFTQRAIEQKEPLYKPVVDAKGKEVLEQIEI